MPRVFVTGATGFIGSHLVQALAERGAQVRCLVRPTSRTDLLRAAGAELVSCEPSRPATWADALADVDMVYHLAGVTRTLVPSEFLRVNCTLTEQVAAACAAQPAPPTLVLVSSVAAAGPAPRGQVRIESDPPAPVSHYGRSKLAGEEAAARYASRVPLSIVRPGIVFGPRDPSFLKILQAIRRLHVHATPGLHPPALSYIHVADLVELLLRVADRGSRVPTGENGHAGKGRYFAVAPEYPTYAELGQLLRPLLDRPRAPIVRVPAPLAWCIAGASECWSRARGRAEELNLDKIREALASSWACSGEAARRDLDFTPAHPLAERLRETVEWYRAAGWL